MARSELAHFAVGRLGIARAHSIDRPEVSQLFAADAAPWDAAGEFFGGFARIYSFFAAADDGFRCSLRTVAKTVDFYPFAPPPEGHVAAAYLTMLGEAAEPLDVRLDVTDKDRVAARVRLEGLGWHERDFILNFILILPGSGSRRKNWPVENFIELAKRLARLITPIVVLGPAEMEMKGVFREQGIATLADIELGELAGLASRARAFVGNDSGVTHLAAATGTPGVAIFGPTDPWRWRPLGTVRVIYREPITDIAVEEMTTQLEAVLSTPWPRQLDRP